MMLGMLMKMKRKMMVAEEFVLFLPVSTELNGGSYTIAVLRDIHVERILTRTCFTVIFFS